MDIYKIYKYLEIYIYNFRNKYIYIFTCKKMTAILNLQYNDRTNWKLHCYTELEDLQYLNNSVNNYARIMNVTQMFKKALTSVLIYKNEFLTYFEN